MIMNEKRQHDIQKEAMEWVREVAKDWISEGLDLEKMIDRAWLRYGLVAYRVNNSKKNNSG